jgi:hypothetical protein
MTTDLAGLAGQVLLPGSPPAGLQQAWRDRAAVDELINSAKTIERSVFEASGQRVTHLHPALERLPAGWELISPCPRCRNLGPWDANRCAICGT